jgi:hypothetical protein
MGIRDTMQKNPMVGWVLAGSLLLAAGAIFVVRSRPSEQQQLTQIVTIRCSETGETWTMPRGALEKQLMMRKYPLDSNDGLPNPKTGKNTGFPIDQWKETIDRVNHDLGIVNNKGGAGGGGGKPAAPAPGGGK